MVLVIRRTLIGLLAAALAVIGGGFASAAGTGNDSDSDSHTVTYTILSYRAIALGGPNADSVDFGNVRQGHIAYRRGPVIRYATTWAGDKIYVSVSKGAFEYGQDGVDLRLFAYGTPISNPTYLGPQQPSNPAVLGDSNGAGVCDGWDVNNGTYDETPEGQANGTLLLSTATQPFVTGISDCGVDTLGGWARLQTYFSVDARNAASDTDYSTEVTGTVTYVIDFGI